MRFSETEARRLSSASGFALIEILVAVAIVGVIAVIAFPPFPFSSTTPRWWTA